MKSGPKQCGDKSVLQHALAESLAYLFEESLVLSVLLTVLLDDGRLVLRESVSLRIASGGGLRPRNRAEATRDLGAVRHHDALGLRVEACERKVLDSMQIAALFVSASWSRKSNAKCACKYITWKQIVVLTRNRKFTRR